MAEPMLLRVPEVADVLRVSRAKVNMLIASGDLPSVKIGWSRRIKPEDLRVFIEQRKVAPAPKEDRSDAA